MSAKDIIMLSNEMSQFKAKREAYKKHFWVHSPKMDHLKKKNVKKIFVKIDRLRNNLNLWIKHVMNDKPSNYHSYMTLIHRSRNEVHSNFRQLDKLMHQS